MEVSKHHEYTFGLDRSEFEDLKDALRFAIGDEDRPIEDYQKRSMRQLLESLEYDGYRYR